jgi:FKBP-type peptidyl-prolyl cis-trans isomerase FkpA
MKKGIIIVFGFLLLGFASCNKEESVSTSEQLAIDVEKIEKYLSDNGLTAQKTASGLHYIITEPGTGTSPNINSTVTVKYVGRLLDGTEFDRGTATFALQTVIEGWQEGIPLFKLQGKGKLIIPSTLGYGSSGTGDIPANSVLVFDIYLISFN